MEIFQKISQNHLTEGTLAKSVRQSLGYLSLDGARKMACGGSGEGYCTACFGTEYPTEIPTKTDKDRFERKLSEKDKEES